MDARAWTLGQCRSLDVAYPNAMPEWYDASAQRERIVLWVRAQGGHDGIAFPTPLVHVVLRAETKRDNWVLSGPVANCESLLVGSLVCSATLGDGKGLPMTLNMWPRTHAAATYHQIASRRSRHLECIIRASNQQEGDMRRVCPAGSAR